MDCIRRGRLDEAVAHCAPSGEKSARRRSQSLPSADGGSRPTSTTTSRIDRGREFHRSSSTGLEYQSSSTVGLNRNREFHRSTSSPGAIMNRQHSRSFQEPTSTKMESNNNDANDNELESSLSTLENELENELRRSVSSSTASRTSSSALSNGRRRSTTRDTSHRLKSQRARSLSVGRSSSSVMRISSHDHEELSRTSRAFVPRETTTQLSPSIRRPSSVDNDLGRNTINSRQAAERGNTYGWGSSSPERSIPNTDGDSMLISPKLQKLREIKERKAELNKRMERRQHRQSSYHRSLSLSSFTDGEDYKRALSESSNSDGVSVHIDDHVGNNDVSVMACASVPSSTWGTSTAHPTPVTSGDDWLRCVNARANSTASQSNICSDATTASFMEAARRLRSQRGGDCDESRVIDDSTRGNNSQSSFKSSSGGNQGRYRRRVSFTEHSDTKECMPLHQKLHSSFKEEKDDDGSSSTRSPRKSILSKKAETGTSSSHRVSFDDDTTVDIEGKLAYTLY